VPHAGGEYLYLSRAIGPAWGFLTGWAGFTLTFSAAAAAMAKVAATYLAVAAGWESASDGLALRASGIVIVAALTLANVAGARVAGRTTALLTALPVAAIAGTFVFGWIRGGAVLSGPADSWAAPPRAWPIALGAALVPVFFTYSGWNAAAYVAGELERPERTLPRALLLGTAAVTGLYLLWNALLLGLLGDGLAGSATPAADAMTRLAGPAATRVLALAIAAAVLGSANVTLMAGARVYYAMARDGLAPSLLARASRRGVPAASLLAGGLWTALLCAAAPVERLVDWTSLAILLLSSLTVVGLVVLRRR
jgi:APA family basic amino acid/polyamine antiporter